MPLICTFVIVHLPQYGVKGSPVPISVVEWNISHSVHLTICCEELCIEWFSHSVSLTICCEEICMEQLSRCVSHKMCCEEESIESSHSVSHEINIMRKYA